MIAINNNNVRAIEILRRHGAKDKTDNVNAKNRTESENKEQNKELNDKKKAFPSLDSETATMTSILSNEYRNPVSKIENKNLSISVMSIKLERTDDETFGMMIIFDGEKQCLNIIHLLEKSIAETKELKIGDQIKEIDGEKINEKNSSEMI